MPRSVLVLGVLVGLAGCPNTVSIQQPQHGQAGAGDGDRDGEAGEDGDASATATRAPGPELPSGALCDTTADCGEGQICEGVGCDPGMGRCVSSERMCTRDLAEYCGCDGATFSGSGSCPGARFAYRGACGPEREDGEACTDARQCRSGQCLGAGLEGCSSSAQGVCGRADCTRDAMTYCSCNNTEFHGSGTCPGRQFAYRGPCEGAAATGGG